MKLEVGMYVRFDYYRVTVPIQISKVTNVEYDDVEKYYMYHTEIGLVLTDDNLVCEPSHNIIDIIEVGDIITTNNLCGEVTKIDINNNKIWVAGCDYETCRSEDIKSIVTKEQFSALEYKIGE